MYCEVCGTYGVKWNEAYMCYKCDDCNTEYDLIKRR